MCVIVSIQIKGFVFLQLLTQMIEVYPVLFYLILLYLLWKKIPCY